MQGQKYDIRALGLEAEGLLGNEAFAMAVEMCMQTIIDSWRAAETPEARERLHARQEELLNVAKALKILMDRKDALEASEDENADA